MTVQTPDPEPVLLQAYAGESWADLNTGADEIFGAELEKLESLTGVPFVVIRLTFRSGEYDRDYVSADIITAPAEMIEARRAQDKIPAVHADPSSHLVFNVAGTGAYRQFVSYLEARQFIKLPEGPDGGAWGESRLDTPVTRWGVHKAFTVHTDESGEFTSATFDVRLRCPRGLRRSIFDAEVNGKTYKGSEVYYLA